MLSSSSMMEVHSLCVFTKRKLRKNKKISEWDVLCDMFTESTSTVNIRIWWSFRLLPCENVLFSVYQSNVTNITMKTINFQHPINIASLGVRHQAIDTKRNHCYRKKFSSATVHSIRIRSFVWMALEYLHWLYLSIR